MIQVFRPVVFTSNISFTIHSILTILLLFRVCSWRRNGSVWMAFHQPAQSIQIVFGCSQSLHNHNQEEVLSINLQSISVGPGGEMGQCRWLPISLPKVSNLFDLWSQPVLSAALFVFQLLSSRCQRSIKIHSWKKEDFRRVPRWKIGHGGQCKAENGLRHSALSVSELCVNSLV